MDPTAPTNFLDACARSGAKTASEKYADTTGSFAGRARGLADYLLRSHPQPEGVPFVRGLGEGLRHSVFGDPLTMVDEVRQGRSAIDGLKNVARKTFVPTSAASAALSYGLPLATTALQYSQIPAEERRYHRGALAGGTLGGMIGGQIGGRFGVPGALLIGPAMQRAGMWLGGKLDPKRPEQGHYQVNPAPPGARMPIPKITPVPGAPPNPAAGRTPGL